MVGILAIVALVLAGFRRVLLRVFEDVFVPKRTARATSPEFARDTEIRDLCAAAIAATGSVIFEFYFPRPARIQRYFGIVSAAEAADAAKITQFVFVNTGTGGGGSTTLATLTNATGVADSATAKSSAWVAHDAKEIVTVARPSLAAGSATNVMDSIAAGEVVKCTHSKAAGTATSDATAGMEFIWSS